MSVAVTNFALTAATARLETRRVILRQFVPDDIEELARICADREVLRHLGPRGEPMSRAESEAALAGIIAHWGRHGFGRWAAVLKGSRRLIGYAGLRAFGPDLELVYLLDRPSWGAGLATELAEACLRFGFGRLGRERVVAFAKPPNAASRRVLEKVGMRFRCCAQFGDLLDEAGVTRPADRTVAEVEVAAYELSRAEYFGARAAASPAKTE